MDQFEREERELLDQADGVATLGEFFEWLQRCDECIERLEERGRAKRPRISVAQRQSVVARIARLAGEKARLQRRFVHVGGDYASTSDSCGGDVNRLAWREIEAAFGSRIATGAVINANYIEPRRFLEDACNVVVENVCAAIERHGSVKVNTAFNGEFVTGEKRANKSINTRNYELFRCSDVREWYDRCVVESTLASLEEFQERDSGWALSRILNITVNINKYNAMRAGCRVKLPREIAMKRAVVSVQSMDNACFAWSAVAALYPAERNSCRESSYPHYTAVLKLNDIEMPVTLKDVGKFERLNGISVNVYGIERTMRNKLTILPIRLTNEKKERHANLLYVSDDDDDNNVGHFAAIKNLSRLVGSQLSSHKEKKYICDRCLHYFYTSEKLDVHIVDCGRMNDCAIRLPAENDKWLTFTNFSNRERVPFVVYADLECTLAKAEQPEDPTKKTYTIQQHEVYSIAYYVRCAYDDSQSSYRCHRDNDCVAWFVAELH